jgi:hypothetical protein
LSRHHHLLPLATSPPRRVTTSSSSSSSSSSLPSPRPCHRQHLLTTVTADGTATISGGNDNEQGWRAGMTTTSGEDHNERGGCQQANANKRG